MPDVLTASGISGDDLFTVRDQSILEDWQPRDRANFTLSYRKELLSGSLSFNHYGEYTVIDGGSQTFGSELLIDVQANFELQENLVFTVGGNNITNETPDEVAPGVGQSRSSPSGGLIDPVTGQLAANSPGVFPYSRRSAPFGFNGAFVYLQLRYKF